MGQRLEVHWLLEGEWYAGVVTHVARHGRHWFYCVLYDDGMELLVDPTEQVRQGCSSLWQLWQLC